MAGPPVIWDTEAVSARGAALSSGAVARTLRTASCSCTSRCCGQSAPLLQRRQSAGRDARASDAPTQELRLVLVSLIILLRTHISET